MVVIMMGGVKVGTHRDALFVNGILGMNRLQEGSWGFLFFSFSLFYSWGAMEFGGCTGRDQTNRGWGKRKRG